MTGPANILRRLEQAGPPDRELLARFVAERDQAAFAELVRRHGPFVLGVCRRVAGHVQDAEDAFQAVFLVLARKARRLGNPDLLANWLHGVAVRVALKARRSAARRRAREVAVSILPDPPAEAAPVLSDLGPVLDEELAALPSWYREAILLCDLRGLSREEAATLLGVPEGTLSSRLANGRKKLAARLTKRGVSLSVATMPMLISRAEAGSALSNELMTKTCGLVANWSAGGLVPEPFANLAGGLTMRKTITFGAVMMMAVAGAVVGAGAINNQDPPQPQKTVAAGKGERPSFEKKNGKERAAFTTRPRLMRASDTDIFGSTAIVWNPTGTLLALLGREEVPGPVGRAVPKAARLALKVISLDGKSGGFWLYGLREKDTLVGFTPDGSEIVTSLREYELVSGFHRLTFWRPDKEVPGSATFAKVTRTINLEDNATHGYALSADGKTFRTLLLDFDKSAKRYRKLTVLVVDVGSGKTSKTLMSAQGEFVNYALSPNGERLSVLYSVKDTKTSVKDTKTHEVAVYDVDRGSRTWAKPANFGHRPWGEFQMEFSPDGGRLLLTNDSNRPLVYRSDTGDELPRLELAEALTPFQPGISFSGDG